mgnify:CR=1 FL=1
MKIYGTGLIGDDWAYYDGDYLPGDTEEKFIANLATQPEDWYYRTHSIKYSYNGQGHRCKDIGNIDLNNYILFTGCSHTEGIGLEIEKTYPYIVAEQLKCDYYNLALSATGIDVVEHNLLTWFLKFKKKPKAVFVQWPDHSRFCGLYPKKIHLHPCGTWNMDIPGFETTKTFILNGELSGFFNARKHLSHRLIHQYIDVPIIGLSFSNNSLYDNQSLIFRKLDLARDLAHCGIKSNEAIASRLIEEFKNR